jgi:hypothetical protein
MAFQDIKNRDTRTADGHETRPLFTIAAICVARGKIGETLAFGYEKWLTGLVLNQEITDIEARGLKRNTEHFECLG